MARPGRSVTSRSPVESRIASLDRIAKRRENAVADRKIIRVGQMKAPAKIAFGQPSVEKCFQYLSAHGMQACGKTHAIAAIGVRCRDPVATREKQTGRQPRAYCAAPSAVTTGAPEDRLRGIADARREFVVLRQRCRPETRKPLDNQGQGCFSWRQVRTPMPCRSGPLAPNACDIARHVGRLTK